MGYEKKTVLNDFLKEAAITAWNRMGISPVGVFTVRYTVEHFPQKIGESKIEPVTEYSGNNPEIIILLPHPSMESCIHSNHRLFEDEQFLKEGAEYINASISNPSYVRYESSCLMGFPQMPALEPPKEIKKKTDNPLYELRIYESHSEQALRKKIEMFNEGGEIDLFRKKGITPVFFGETLTGSCLPNLNYMLAFENMNQRTQNWQAFRESRQWQKMQEKKEYQDLVSKITDIILTPTSYSQI